MHALVRMHARARVYDWMCMIGCVCAVMYKCMLGTDSRDSIQC